MAATSTSFATATSTPVVIGAAAIAPNINPLTGLKVTNLAILNRRPVMVKESNFPRTGRPQNGKQCSFKNVTILFFRYNELLHTLFEMEISGNTAGRRVVYFRDGKMIEGFWQSSGPNQPLYLMNSWGAPGRAKTRKQLNEMTYLCAY